MLQACIEDLPNLPDGSLSSDALADGWVGAACARHLHLLRAEQDMARSQQQSRKMLPDRPPDDSRYQFTVIFHPAEMLGGDFYDFVSTSDGRIVALVADVMGHGVPAALLVSAVKVAFRIGVKAGASEQVLQAMNRILNEVLPMETFVAATVVVLSSPSEPCSYAAAGMPAALLLRASPHDSASIQQSAYLLGLFDDATYERHTFALQTGDSLCLTTDGALDVRNETGEFFGASRLLAALNEPSGNGTQMTTRILDALTRFAPEPYWIDDICILVAKAK